MRLDDLTVEVRTIDLERVGQIPHRLLDFAITPTLRGVGEWRVTLPFDHPLTDVLRMPGSGIIVSHRGQVLDSGTVTSPTVETTRDDPAGLVTVTGLTDNVLLADALAWPTPGSPISQQGGHDKRSGAAETVMRGYVDANIGPGGQPARRGRLAQRLILAPDLGRGRAITKSARFQVLGELLTDIAILAGLGFRIRQADPSRPELVFEVWQPADRSATVRFSVAGGTLTSEQVATSPPGLTRAIVGGQGELAARTLLQRTTPDSLTAEGVYGRVIERFIDQRQTDDLTELQQAGDEPLTEEGFAATSATATPSETPGMRFGVDWQLGDTVTVVLFHQETTAPVTSVAIEATARDGLLVAAAIGDVTGFNQIRALDGRVSRLASRLSALERNDPIG